MHETDTIFKAGVAALAGMIKRKELSPVEVVDVFLQRIWQHNDKINAFCTVAAEEAGKRAKEIEKAVMLDEDLPLGGIPIAIKDLTPTKGIRTSFGSKIFAENVPSYDATFVTRVKQAGAIVIGKTNTPEFGYTGTTDNLIFGKTSNPWDISRTSGGSSGGSAAAVAARLIPVAEGSDGGGSVRIPASACGIYGFKPTYGRIPFDSAPSKFSSNSPFLHHGTLTFNVDDAAYMLDILQGPDSRDPYSLPKAQEAFFPIMPMDLKGLKVAYSPNLDYFEIDSEVREIVEKAIHSLTGLGCKVEEVTPGFEAGRELVTETFISLWAVYYAAFYENFLPRWETEMSKGFVATIKSGQKISAVTYKRLERARSKVYNKIEKIFSQYDLLITPTLAVPAFPHGPGPMQINGRQVDPYADWMLTSVFNLTGHPAASINCGYTKEGLPVGLQIAAPRFDEGMIFRLSKAFEIANADIFKIPPEFDNS